MMISRTTRQQGQLGRRVAGVAAATALMLGAATGAAFAQIGCEGANATSDSGARSADLAIRTQQETIDKAKAGAKLDPIPTFLGIAISFSHTDHDGYRLRRPVEQRDCLGNLIAPINQLLPFESSATSASGLIEFDLTKRMGLADVYLFKAGVGIGGKHLRTDYEGVIRTPATAAAGGPANGVNVANGALAEHGVQFDFYTLLAHRTTYAILAASLGFGDSEINNFSFGTFGGGRGETDYHDHSFQATIGHVFTVASHANRNVLLDLSGGLLYASYTRDAFTDTRGVRFSDAETDEFSGKLEAKLAFQHIIGDGTLTPYIKAGVKHRFDYESTVTVFNPQTGICGVANCDFTAAYSLTSDDTFWRVGGGVAVSLGGDRQSGLFEIFYEGSGDSNEIGAKAQYVVKLH